MSDIVDLAILSGFATLVETLKTAGLVETLKGSGPFTVFAPTDDAFNRLPTDVMKGLSNDAAKAKNVLLYHIVPGKLMSEEIVKLKTLKTVQGQELRIDPPKGFLHKNPRVNNINIIKMDQKATNGVIHVIDEVLIPR